MLQDLPYYVKLVKSLGLYSVEDICLTLYMPQ